MSSTEVIVFAFQILQGVVLIVGIPLVIIQIRQQTKAINLQSESVHISIYMQLMQEGSRISELALDDNDLAEFYDERKLPKEFSSKWESMGKKYRKFYFYLGRNLSLMEQAFILWNMGWIGHTDYRAMLERLFEMLGLIKFCVWWPNMRPFYRSDFGSYVDALQGKNRQEFFKLAMAKYPKIVF
jgi:hypothetical protein